MNLSLYYLYRYNLAFEWSGIIPEPALEANIPIPGAKRHGRSSQSFPAGAGPFLRSPNAS